MMDERMKALIAAPLADPSKIFLPEGKRRISRGPRPQYEDGIEAPKVSGKELAERRSKAAWKKLEALYDYYAGTNLTAERIAEHMGVYRQEQTGVDDKGKPVFVRVLDVKTVEAQIAWRRK